MVDLRVHTGIGRLVVGFVLPMFDQRPFPLGSQLAPKLPIIVALVRGQRREPFQIPLAQPGSDLRVMLAGRCTSRTVCAWVSTNSVVLSERVWSFTRWV